MNIISGIKSLFSVEKTRNDIFDKDNGHLAKIGEWIDNRSFSTEEQQKLNYEMSLKIQDFAVATMSENTERSKARRDIAVFSIKCFWLLVFMCAMIYKIDPEWSAFIFSLVIHPAVSIPVGGVFAFFYGVYAMQRNNETKKK